MPYIVWCVFFVCDLSSPFSVAQTQMVKLSVVVITVVVYDQAVFACLAVSIDVGTERVVGVGRWSAVVVTGCRVGTTGDLVGITYAVVITVVVYD